MRPQANFPVQLAVITVFAASCVLILVYLWSAFGGPVPLRPHGYQLKADFAEANNLALNADVRISGVNVGHVVAKENQPGTTRITFDVDERYAPLPSDINAQLRQKTAFGEIYLALSPGHATAPRLQDGALLPPGRLSPSVELDEIFRAFDPKTRASLRTWFATQAEGLQGRGRDISDSIGQLPGFAENTETLLADLKVQDEAVRRLVRNTGVVFDAISERSDQLRGSIKNWNAVMETVASRNQELEDTFRALPAFEREGQALVER